MRFVPLKSIWQQDLQMLHRIRELAVKDRTAKANQARGLLAEYSIVIPRGITRLKKEMPRILESADNGLTYFVRELFSELNHELMELEVRVKGYDKRILKIFNQNPTCQKLGQLAGVGPLTATAVMASVGDASSFKMAGSCPPGWAWFPGSTPAATKRGSWESANAATAT
jgi:transposase